MARNEPRPAQAKLPIWIGGGGEQRTLRIAARFADGWNVPFMSPDTFARKRRAPRAPPRSIAIGDIACAVNVGLAWTEQSLRDQFGAIADFVRPGVLGGSVAEVVDRIGNYVDAGADQVNLALRALRPRRPRSLRQRPRPRLSDGSSSAKVSVEEALLLLGELLGSERAPIAQRLQALELHRHVV